MVGGVVGGAVEAWRASTQGSLAARGVTGWAAWAWRAPSEGSPLAGGAVGVGGAGEAAVAAEVCWAVEAEADRVAITAAMAGRRGPGGVAWRAFPNTK